MMRCVPIAIFLSVLVTSTLQMHGREVSNCVWEYEDGTRVDLNSLGNTDGTPKWNNEPALNPDPDPNFYTINPCHPFTMGTECQNVTVCRFNPTGILLNIADASSGRMYYNEDDNDVVLEYNHTDPSDPDVLYISRFAFASSGQPEAQILVQGIIASTPFHVTHRFLLLLPNAPAIAPALTTDAPVTAQPIRTQSSTSPPASFTAQPIRSQSSTAPPASVSLHPIRTQSTTLPPASISLHPIRTQTAPVTKVTVGPPIPPQGLTAGGVICIVFVCCLCGYFLIGAFYMFFFGGARGMEIIPHSRFWLDLPNLVMEGFFFLFSCCGNVQMVSSSGGEEYDKI